MKEKIELQLIDINQQILDLYVKKADLERALLLVSDVPPKVQIILTDAAKP